MCADAISLFPYLRDRSALPALRKSLDEREAEVFLSAARAIWMIERDEQVLRRIVELLDHADPEVRSLAMKHVAGLAEFTHEVFPHIVAHAKDTDTSVRHSAVGAMVHFGKKGIPVLIDGMSDADRMVRYGAVVIAKVIGPEAIDAIPALENRLADPDSDVAHEALQALRAIDPQRHQRLKVERKTE